jgi:uncharacterized repeat protein (TIGR03837 family)
LKIASCWIFCKVIDNFGDAGVCLRLARQLELEHQIETRIICDQLDLLERLDPIIRSWSKVDQTTPTELALPDLIVSGFSCDLPDVVLEQMAAAVQAPIWINLEYLSAEAWVNDCHLGQSTKPSGPGAGCTQHFFFPGFNPKTGGLLRELDLLGQRDHFITHERAAFLASLNIHVAPETKLHSLFCYPDAPIDALVKILQAQSQAQHVVTVEGVASAQIAKWIEKLPLSNLTLQVIPFQTQANYDRLLWACDHNFVRGEDSLVRAIWAGKPLTWQIYPQTEGTHLNKLNAWLAGWMVNSGESEALSVARHGILAWNDFAADPDSHSVALNSWISTVVSAELDNTASHSGALITAVHEYATSLANQQDLASQLLAHAFSCYNHGLR